MFVYQVSVYDYKEDLTYYKYGIVAAYNFEDATAYLVNRYTNTVDAESDCVLLQTIEYLAEVNTIEDTTEISLSSFEDIQSRIKVRGGRIK